MTAHQPKQELLTLVINSIPHFLASAQRTRRGRFHFGTTCTRAGSNGAVHHVPANSVPAAPACGVEVAAGGEAVGAWMPHALRKAPAATAPAPVRNRRLGKARCSGVISDDLILLTVYPLSIATHPDKWAHRTRIVLSNCCRLVQEIRLCGSIGSELGTLSSHLSFAPVVYMKSERSGS